MFGKRADGVKVKKLPVIDKAMPYMFPMRIDSVNLYEQAINCEAIDKFILEQKKNTGIHYTYTEIFIAAAVRMLYERPKTNRFINNCVVYQRNYISVSLSIMTSLRDDEGEEITLKMFFKGTETLQEIKKIFDDEVAKNVKKDSETHKTTKFASVLAAMPHWMYKFAMACIRFGDKHNLLPRWILDCSPFHTSIYLSDLRSIHLDALYHHLYNLGNTTIFGTMGKSFNTPVVTTEGDIKSQKTMNLRFTLDERVCNGLYYSNSLKFLLKLIQDPSILLEKPAAKTLSKKEQKIWDKERKRENKQMKKREKKAAKKVKSKGN